MPFKDPYLQAGFPNRDLPTQSEDDKTIAQTPRSQILRYFVFEHLPEKLQGISQPFSILAEQMEASLPTGPEKSVALRKLLEAKDAAVRSALDLP